MRLASPEDAAAIARVHVRTWQVAYAQVFPEPELRGLSEEARTVVWRRILSEPADGEQTVVAELDGEVVGFASTGPVRDEADLGELRAIYAVPQVWGKGVGRALMEHALTWLSDAGHEAAVLWVLADNPRARHFYERYGWTLDGATREETILGTAVSEVRYRFAL